MFAFSSNPEIRHISDKAVAFYYNNRHATPSHQLLVEAAKVLESCIGKTVSVEAVSAMLELSPRARITLAVNGDPSNSDTRGFLLQAMSEFFLCCEWPQNDSGVNFQEFLTALYKQMEAMGF